MISAPLVEPAVEASAAPVAAAGRLRLEIDAARDVLIFVDGYFAGTSAELDHELELEPGLHRIELRAAGYQTQQVDVRITASRTIAYRTAMVSIEPAEPLPSSEPLPRTTIYFIPGCYLGNVPPADVSLPAGCDLSKLTIRRP